MQLSKLSPDRARELTELCLTAGEWLAQFTRAAAGGTADGAGAGAGAAAGIGAGVGAGAGAGAGAVAGGGGAPTIVRTASGGGVDTSTPIMDWMVRESIVGSVTPQLQSITSRPLRQLLCILNATFQRLFTSDAAFGNFPQCMKVRR
jgi:hypothetical protein